MNVERTPEEEFKKFLIEKLSNEEAERIMEDSCKVFDEIMRILNVCVEFNSKMNDKLESTDERTIDDITTSIFASAIVTILNNMDSNLRDTIVRHINRKYQVSSQREERGEKFNRMFY